MQNWTYSYNGISAVLSGLESRKKIEVKDGDLSLFSALDEDFVPKLGNFVSRGDADNSDQMRMNAFKFSVHNAASINSNDRTQQQRSSQFFVAADNRVPAKSSFFSHRKQV